MLPPLELPVIQNWSCHSCGGCCRQHEIEITDEERQRIESQNWTAADGIAGPWHVKGGPFWNRTYRLTHQADGACVFLDEKGLCKIHAKFGEPAKPLACRVYPFALHPAGKSITVSLRFSCPSVVSNKGKPLAARLEELRGIEQLVVPDGAELLPAPYVTGGQPLEWAETHHIVEALDTVIEAGDVQFPVRLLRALFVVDMLGQTNFEKIRGDRLTELLQILLDASVEEVTTNPASLPQATRPGRMHFRLLAGQYARRDTHAELARGWLYRYQLFKASLKFTHGGGVIPQMQELFPAGVKFADLERPFGPLPAGAEELWVRYFRVKLLGLAFCGPAFYGAPIVEGFHSLALVFPVVQWLARWLAVGAGRASLNLADIERALAIADHHHGYSPALGLANNRARIRMLAKLGDVTRLVAWYSR